MKKVLLTGATGFIGNYVIAELLKAGHKVIVVSRSMEKAKSCKWFTQVQFIQYDLNQTNENFFRLFQQPDQLIHLAWEGLPNYNELFHLEKNLPCSYYFIKNMVQNGLRNLVVTGTCLEYGLRDGFLCESMETKPVTCYGLAKDTLRKFIEQLQKKFDFEFKWIRLFYLYGEGQNPNSIFSQLEYALANKQSQFNMSGGQQLRDYLPVEKVAQYITKIAQQHHTNGIINCCSGTHVSIKKLVEDYLRKNQKSIHLNLGYYPYPDYESMAFWGDVAKLKIALGENV